MHGCKHDTSTYTVALFLVVFCFSSNFAFFGYTESHATICFFEKHGATGATRRPYGICFVAHSCAALLCRGEEASRLTISPVATPGATKAVDANTTAARCAMRGRVVAGATTCSAACLCIAIAVVVVAAAGVHNQRHSVRMCQHCKCKLPRQVTWKYLGQMGA